MVNKRVVLGIAAILVGGAGLATVVLGSGDGDTTAKPFAVAQVNEGQATIPPDPTQAQQGFETMAVEADNVPECSAPRAPNDLSPKAYIRNSYAAIKEIMAAERWQETGSCECFLNEITWEQVVSAAPNFERTDGVALQFDFPKLRAEADELVALRAQACSE